MVKIIPTAEDDTITSQPLVDRSESMNHVPIEASKVFHGRTSRSSKVWRYGLLAVVMLTTGLTLQGSAWNGNRALYTTLEVSALALLIVMSWLSWRKVPNAAEQGSEALSLANGRLLRELHLRKAAEEMLERSNHELARSKEELSEFAYVASHDLKAPLRAIDNLASWIAEDAIESLPKDSRVNLTRLRQRATRMGGLLDDLLEYSRVGKAEGEIEQIDSRAITEEAAAPVVRENGFKVVFQDPSPTFTSNKAPLRQVLTNLIENAVKHHDRADGQVEISARDQGEFIEFVVTDDGPGIPSEFHQRIFKVFQTLQPRDDVEGSGMGLAIAKKVIESRGGTIQVDSPDARGSRFRFTWPRDRLTWPRDRRAERQ